MATWDVPRCSWNARLKSAEVRGWWRSPVRTGDANDAWTRWKALLWSSSTMSWPCGMIARPRPRGRHASASRFPAGFPRTEARAGAAPSRHGGFHGVRTTPTGCRPRGQATERIHSTHGACQKRRSPDVIGTGAPRSRDTLQLWRGTEERLPTWPPGLTRSASAWPCPGLAGHVPGVFAGPSRRLRRRSGTPRSSARRSVIWTLEPV